MPGPIEAFAERIAAKHGVTVPELLGRCNFPSIARARREFFAVTVDTLALSASEAGKMFGRDHSTILSAVRKYREART